MAPASPCSPCAGTTVPTPEHERDEYERVVLGALPRILVEPGSQAANLARQGDTYGGVRMERGYLDEFGPEHANVILFRNLDRPQCPFGYRRRAVETPDTYFTTAPIATPTSCRRRVCGGDLVGPL